MRAILPALEADAALYRNYIYAEDPPLPLPVRAYGGADDPNVRREHLEGWAEQTTASFAVRVFPGGHFYLNTAREPFLQALEEWTCDADPRRSPHLARAPQSRQVPPPTAEEMERAARFATPVLRRRYLRAHAALRAILGSVTDCPLEFALHEKGKPYLASAPEVRFNLAHSHEMALVAVTRDVEVGVDIEQIRQTAGIRGDRAALLSPRPPRAFRRARFLPPLDAFRSAAKGAWRGTLRRGRHAARRMEHHRTRCRPPLRRCHCGRRRVTLSDTPRSP